MAYTDQQSVLPLSWQILNFLHQFAAYTVCLLFGAGLVVDSRFIKALETKLITVKLKLKQWVEKTENSVELSGTAGGIIILCVFVAIGNTFYISYSQLIHFKYKNTKLCSFDK